MESAQLAGSELLKLEQTAKELRREILNIIFRAGSGHPGGSLSATDILTALYFGGILHYDPKQPEDPNRDRFILSKGHGILGLISALRVTGVISEEVFNSFQSNESHLIAHPIMNLDLGIESSAGHYLVKGLDHIGIWLEHPGVVLTKTVDKDGKPIPDEKIIKEKVDANFLVTWDNIKSMMHYPNREGYDFPSEFKIDIGFK